MMPGYNQVYLILSYYNHLVYWDIISYFNLLFSTDPKLLNKYTNLFFYKFNIK